jgi:hypothetical protein
MTLWKVPSAARAVLGRGRSHGGDGKSFALTGTTSERSDWTDAAWESDDEELRSLGLALLDEVVADVGRRFRIVWDDD